MLPKDPYILLSTVNMKLRDHYDTLEDYCKSNNYDMNDLCGRLSKVNYHYDNKTNQFK